MLPRRQGVRPSRSNFAFIGRQLGRILTLALNWATIVLFGRVPQDRQLHLSGMALTALVWPIVLAGIAFDGCPRDRGRTEARVTRPGRRRSASLWGVQRSLGIRSSSRGGAPFGAPPIAND